MSNSIKRSERLDAHIRGIVQLLTEQERRNYCITLDFLNEMWEELSSQEKQE